MTVAIRPRGHDWLRPQRHTGVSGWLAVQHREHVPDGEIGHRGPRLACGAAEMRREHDVLELQERWMNHGSRS